MRIGRIVWEGIGLCGVSAEGRFIPVPPEAPMDADDIISLLCRGLKCVSDFSSKPLDECPLLRVAVMSVTVNLRREWCKQLFAWKFTRPSQAERSRPSVCSWSCRAALMNWKRDRSGVQA